MAQNTENRALNDKFMLRLPDGMRDRIKAAAEANKRSMNAEIVERLERSFDKISNFTGWDRVSHRLGHVSGVLDMTAEFLPADLADKLRQASDILSNIDIGEFTKAAAKYRFVPADDQDGDGTGDGHGDGGSSYSDGNGDGRGGAADGGGKPKS